MRPEIKFYNNDFKKNFRINILSCSTNFNSNSYLEVYVYHTVYPCEWTKSYERTYWVIADIKIYDMSIMESCVRTREYVRISSSVHRETRKSSSAFNGRPNTV